MRLCVLSDLHAAARLPATVAAVAQGFRRADASWLICAGDVGGGGAADCLRCLTALDQAVDGRLLYVPGNHDIWCRPGTSGDSWDEWRRLLTFSGNLERGTRELGDGWTAVGTGGWYDYSLAVEGPWSADDVARKHWENVLWRDAEFARWGAADAEVSQGFLQLLEQRLGEARESGGRIVAVTHVVPFAGVLDPPGDDRSHAFCQAFMGSSAYGGMLAKAGCKLAVFGHSHVRRRGIADGGVPYVGAPLGYPKEWTGSGDVAEEVAAAMAVVDL